MELTKDLTTWRVLIIDDEADNLSLASDFLEFSGAVTAKAESGKIGLELVDQFKPNLILLDVWMPTMDGWEVLRRLRARPELNPIPVVALTALAMPADAEKVRAAGFDAYITKPFRVKVLLEGLIACIQTFAAKQTALPDTATESSQA